MKGILIALTLLCFCPSVFSADLYDFGYDKSNNRVTTQVKRETGFKRSDSKSTESNDEDFEIYTEQYNSRYGGEGCEESKTVGNAVVTLKNNCSKDGKPLLGFGK